MTKLNTTNPDHFTYEYEMLRIEILDRMRADLKDSPCPPIRHNLDLYNGNQLENFISKTAQHLEGGKFHPIG